MKKFVFAAVTAAVMPAGSAFAQEAPFGTEADAAYAAEVWAAMVDLNLAGENQIMSFPYEGIDPHGMMLETFYTTATIGGQTGDLIVKRNYGPEGISIDQVLSNPADHLGAFTVMFRREAGYDADNQDWFWVKYLPDGTLDKNPMGMQLAGRVAKGANVGCIACHAAAPGDDYIFTSDAISAMME
ncbi:MAG: cytochrome P460 family protein [Rhodobacteraceae bacterium]|nr:cytochrome P460 family protein [Paracoccaceae bacterium]